jgi:hypothetical protein
MLKISRPVLYLFIATIGVAAFLLANPPQAPRAIVKKKSTPRVEVTSTIYRPEDYTASFTGLVGVSKNSFKPLVARKSNALSAVLLANGGIPPEFAGGDANWVCTGTAEVDGVRQALLENKSTNEGVFLKQGEHWKNAVVSQVFEDAVVLVGPGGEAKTIHIQQEVTPDQSEVTGNMPVQPSLSGVIGGVSPPGQVSPMTALPAPTATIQVED